RLLPSGYSRPIYLARRGNRQARQWRNRNAGIQRRTQPALSSLLLRARYAYGCPFHIQDIRARPPPPRDEPAPDPLLPPCRRLRRNEYQDPRWFRRPARLCLRSMDRHKDSQKPLKCRQPLPDQLRLPACEFSSTALRSAPAIDFGFCAETSSRLNTDSPACLPP